MLIDKIKKRAVEAIEEQEGGIGTVVSWRLVNMRHHQFTVSVRVKCNKSEFEVWGLVDLDTESVSCI